MNAIHCLLSYPFDTKHSIFALFSWNQGQVTHTHNMYAYLYIYIYASVNYVIIGSGNGLVPGHHVNQCWIIANWTLGDNAELLLIGPSGRNFNEIWIYIQNFSFITMHLKWGL